MIEFTENAASTRYVFCQVKIVAIHSGAVQRTRAKRCLLAAGPLTRLTGFVQHELYRRPAPILAHFQYSWRYFVTEYERWDGDGLRSGPLCRPVDIIDAGLSASAPIYGLPIGIH